MNRTISFFTWWIEFIWYVLYFMVDALLGIRKWGKDEDNNFEAVSLTFFVPILFATVLNMALHAPLSMIPLWRYIIAAILYVIGWSVEGIPGAQWALDSMVNSLSDMIQAVCLALIIGLLRTELMRLFMMF